MVIGQVREGGTLMTGESILGNLARARFPQAPQALDHDFGFDAAEPSRLDAQGDVDSGYATRTTSSLSQSVCSVC